MRVASHIYFTSSRLSIRIRHDYKRDILKAHLKNIEFLQKAMSKDKNPIVTHFVRLVSLEKLEHFDDADDDLTNIFQLL